MDLSCNELSEITLPENLPPKLQELDLTGNPRLNLDHKTLEQLKYVWVFFFVFVFCFGGGGVFSPAVFFCLFYMRHHSPVNVASICTLHTGNLSYHIMYV